MQTNQTWVCNGPVDLDSVTVTMTGRSARAAARRRPSAPGCTGRIGRIDVVTSVADGVKVAEGVHDLAIDGGSIRCSRKAPVMHQDGVQVMGGARITFRNMPSTAAARPDG